MKVKASSNFWCVPSQTNLHLRKSMFGPEVLRELAADFGIQAVRRDNEIVRPREIRSAFDLGLEAQRHAERARPLLQQHEASCLRPMPQKPWPVETMRSPR